MSYFPRYLSYVYSPPLVATPWSVATITSTVLNNRRPSAVVVTSTFNYFSYYAPPIRSAYVAPTATFYYSYPWRAPVVYGRFW